MTTQVLRAPAGPAPQSLKRNGPVTHARRLRRAKIVTAQIAMIAVLLATWELVSGRLINDIMISAPSNVFPLIWEWLIDGVILDAAATTFSNAALGLVAGGTAGIAVGVILGQSRLLADTFEPFITALYTMPKHALIPLFIMWVGIGSALGILTSAVIAFFLIFFNTFFGIREVKQSLISSVRIMGGSTLDVLWRVRLPSALVWVVAGLKLAVPQAIVGVVVAEMLAGDQGLGYLVARNASSFNSAGTYAALITLLLAGFLIDRVMTALTKKPLEWKNSGSAM
ncbi:ABC transporter permease [Rhodococcus wratislaviensis]|uniref:Putative ABC transporter permease protein n=1 Tax=Rhodococcus wratislaviensis NBRC 100605 TaxID=1219028 RepID=X0Q0D4_RHOWR|nr:ABC transporter permease [Rhodococcus wratislaviensis]GAF44287.1 putative ABC transporter permease protein [Rhodococcus wratislaviensis NBRC 100605]